MIKSGTVDGPAHWASYLVNNDSSGLTEAEITQADSWRNELGNVNIVSVEGEPRFTTGLQLYAPQCDYAAGEVITYVYLEA